MQGRLWLDLTGVAPGSDTAVLAQRLGPALRRRLGERLALCRRDPVLRLLDDAAFAGLTPAVSADRQPARWRGWPGSAAARLPQPTRIALRKAWTAQLQALGHLRGRDAPAAPVAASAALPAASGDWLLALLPRGDLAPLHRQGLRLALLDGTTPAPPRRDLLPPEARASEAIWQRVSAPLLAARPRLQAPGTLVPPFPRRSLPAPGFILADGEIGLAGATPHLLLAWRRLLDDGVKLPSLVLAGPVGALASDTLAQLTHSAGFGGTVLMRPDPDEAERAALRAACRFALALEPHSAWGRATLDSRAAGIACVSAFAGDVDPGSPAAIATAVLAALAAPPAAPPPPPPQGDWAEVADTILAGLAP